MAKRRSRLIKEKHDLKVGIGAVLAILSLAPWSYPLLGIGIAVFGIAFGGALVWERNKYGIAYLGVSIIGLVLAIGRLGQITC